MKKLHKIQQWLLLAVVFFIPLQARWIFKPGTINGDPSEYTTLSIYATEILICILLVSLLYPLLQKITKVRKKGKHVLPVIALLLLIGWLLLSVGPWWPLALQKLTWLVLGASIALSIALLKPKRTVLFTTLAVAGTLQALLAIYQFFIQKVFASTYLGIAAQNPEVLGTPVIIENGARVMRAFGSFPHPNMLGGFLALTLLATIWLLAQKKSKAHLLGLYTIYIAQLLGLLASASRSALLGLLAAMVFLFMYRKKDAAIKKLLPKIFLLSGMIILLVAVLQPQLIEQRFSLHHRIEQQSITTRMEQLRQVDTIVASNWLSGTGIGLYPAALSARYPDQPGWWYQPVHNSYILIATELGLIGLLLVTIFVSLVYFTSERMKLKLKEPTTLIAVSMVIALAIIGVFDHYLWSFYSGILLLALVYGILLSSIKK